MKVRLSALLLLLLLCFKIDAQEIFTPPAKVNTAFVTGEVLTYQIKYGFVVGGIATLSVTDTILNKKHVFHALGVGKTTGLADKLYGIEDIYESWFDEKTNLPYKSVRNISEGSYKHYNEVTYNRKNNTVNSKLSGIHKVPERILDLSSTFYYLRRVDFSKVKIDDLVFVNMYFSDEIFPFYFKYLGTETIKTKFGKINCFKISPVVEVGRMFKANEDLTVWFTNDDNCIPVLVKMDIRIVGAIYLKLISYENIATPLLFQE